MAAGKTEACSTETRDTEMHNTEIHNAAIRNTAKALLVSDGRILVNRCVTQEGEIFYDLPGGGQHMLETMEEAVIREVREETGYTVKVAGFAALAEEINDYLADSDYSEYAHRVIHIFRVEVTGGEAAEPTEMDYQQSGSVWLDLEEADRALFLPEHLNGRISQLARSETPLYLGCVRSQEWRV